MKELETSPIIYELNHDNIVKYSDIWLENDSVCENTIETNTSNKNFILYIQMELCDKPLNEIIDEIEKDSNFYSNKILTPLGYYIVGEIFIDILEGVKYLHERNPPIIHKDLNPWNIMLMIEKHGNSFVKIADMGLATIHEYANQSHTHDRGHSDFLAPEVKDSKTYDTRADIHSLGVVLRKLFLLNFSREYTIQNYNHSKVFLMSKYQKISKLCDKMTRTIVDKRPANIEEILKEKHLWTLHVSEFNAKEEFEKILNNESFVLKFLKKRGFYENGRNVKTFIEKRKIGEGSYGDVYEVSQKNSPEKKYSIKKIKFSAMHEKELMKELKNFTINTELSHENAMKYFEVWLEDDVISKNGTKTYNENVILHIQMELCDKSLNEIIDEIKNDCNFCSNETLTYLGYYIASEICTEILEAVNYLHERNPPIIHRDLNPWNIMLKIEDNCNSFVKIVDLGLAKIHEFAKESHTKDREHLKFLAPEVETRRKYDTRADIYSSGIAVRELFDIDINRDYHEKEENHSSLLISKYQNFKNLCIKMTQNVVAERTQIIKEILIDKNLWALNANEYEVRKEFEESNLNQNLFVYKL